MGGTPRTDAVARALGAAAMRWKGREIDVVAFCEQAESALDDMRKMEWQLNAAHSQLADCYRATGADPDSNENCRLAQHAVDEVKRLRKEFDACDSLCDDIQKEKGRLMQSNALIKSAAEASVDRAHTQGVMDSILRQEIGRLRDEVAELIKDRKRLDWLVNKIAYQPAANGMRWATLNWCVEVDSLSPATIHDAIDAAMEAKS